MEQVALVVAFIAAHGFEILGAITAFLAGCLAIALIVPGKQPDEFLQAVVDFLKKFSRK